MNDILVLGTADWSQPIATNQHYMTRELAATSHVLFCESLGLRRPQVSRRDFQRALTRLRRPHQTSEPRRAIPANVSIVSPRVVPLHNSATFLLNRSQLEKASRAWLESSGPKVLWTYSPVTYGLERYADITIYHCVDLLGEFPGISARMIDSAEHRLAAAGALAIASSAKVASHLTRQGFGAVKLWENVADTDLFERGPASADPAAVFAGNLTANKIDFGLLHSVLDSGMKLHLAGPVAQGGGTASSQVRGLVRRGAIYHGMLELEQLADLFRQAHVGLIPYELNSYTEGVSPLKVYEYLAAGLAVVSTAIPSVRAIDGHVVVAQQEDFAKAVLELPVASPEHVRERRTIAAAHSWGARGQEARQLVADSVGVGA